MRTAPYMRPFEEGVITPVFKGLDSYETPWRPPDVASSLAPSLVFYWRLGVGPFRWICRRAAAGRCDDAAWTHAGVATADTLEGVGARIRVEGLRNADTGGPCVYVGNHMSTLETFMLPGLLRPIRPVTFVLKRSLTTMPFFGAVIRSRDPVAVDRVNPREDLARVLKEGAERLAAGISVIVFPQSTRTLRFDPHRFNSIGVKLAARAGVPVVPLALLTDAWGQGRLIKDVGRIDPSRPVRFRFGAPLRVDGHGREEHAAICAFIESALREWRHEDGG